MLFIKKNKKSKFLFTKKDEKHIFITVLLGL